MTNISQQQPNQSSADSMLQLVNAPRKRQADVEGRFARFSCIRNVDLQKPKIGNRPEKKESTPSPKKLERCNSSPVKLTSPEKRKMTFAHHEASNLRILQTLECVQRTRSEVRATFLETQQTLMKYKEIDQKLQEKITQMLPSEIVQPEFIRSVKVEPNLTRRSEQRKLLAQLRFQQTRNQSNEQSLCQKQVSQADELAAKIEKRRTSSIFSDKKRVNRLPDMLNPIDFMPMHKETQRIRQISSKQKQKQSEKKEPERNGPTMTFMALRAMGLLGSQSNTVAQRQRQKENSSGPGLKIRKVVIGQSQMKLFEDVINMTSVVVSQKSKSNKKSKSIKKVHVKTNESQDISQSRSVAVAEQDRQLIVEDV